ncbi:unnamed protein product [Paramecium sonneborni]|uniref:Uncharacterized protein n=1 Tax=Paramecium sonneborni TaxID=65129 RepID=A0A8S1L551_9CILI|nr:unnamed protein product [Paramecium sonneborni]
MSEDQDELFSAKSEILFNVKQCEELFQKDKSEKLKQDIETFKKNIKIAKEKEDEFYKTLLLETKERESIFGFPGDQLKEDPKLIVWDPLQGNLIITEQEFKNKYDQPRQKNSNRQSQIPQQLDQNQNE